MESRETSGNIVMEELPILQSTSQKTEPFSQIEEK